MVYVTKSPLFTYWEPADLERVIVPTDVGSGVGVPVVPGEMVNVNVNVGVGVNVGVAVGVKVDVAPIANPGNASNEKILIAKNSTAEIFLFFIFPPCSFYISLSTVTMTGYSR
jgi:hypothetical protein